jgi:hypothetical protein
MEASPTCGLGGVEQLALQLGDAQAASTVASWSSLAFSP